MKRNRPKTLNKKIKNFRKRGKTWLKSIRNFRMKEIKSLKKDNSFMKEWKKYKNFKDSKKCTNKS